MLGHNNYLEKTRLDPIDENSPIQHRRVQHNIVTKISSTNENLEDGSRNRQLTIETTVSWSKLPQLKPSLPDIEVISDGTTTSTDAGSESSDDKENDKPEILQCHTRSNSRLQRLETMYSGDSENNIIHRTEDLFSSEQPRCSQQTRDTKPAGRSARLAALANTINQWEDDPRHFPVGKLDKEVSKKSSVLTKHSVVKDKGYSGHRQFISPQKRNGVFNKTTNEPSTGRSQNTVESLKRPESTSLSTDNGPKAKRVTPACGAKEDTKPVVWDKTVIQYLEQQGFSRSVSEQRLIYDYNEKEKPSSLENSLPVKMTSHVQTSPPSLPEKNGFSPCNAEFTMSDSSPRKSPVRERCDNTIQIDVLGMKKTNQVTLRSDNDSLTPVIGVKELGSWSNSQSLVNCSQDSSSKMQTHRWGMSASKQTHSQDIVATKQTYCQDMRPRKQDVSAMKQAYNRDAGLTKQTYSQNVGPTMTHNRDFSLMKHIHSQDLSPTKQTHTRALSPTKQTNTQALNPTKQTYIRALSPTKQTNTQALSPTKQTYIQALSPTKQTNNQPLSATKQTYIQALSPTKQTNTQALNPTKQTHIRALSPTKQTKDPAELPLAERMALFERNAGPPILPRAPLTLPVARGKLQNKTCYTEQKPTTQKSQHINSGPLHDRLAMFEKGPCGSSETKEVVSERQQELDMLRQRWKRNTEMPTPIKENTKPLSPPTPPPLPSPPEPFEFSRPRYFYNEEDQFESEEDYPASKEVRRVTFSPTSSGYFYTQQEDDMESDEISEQDNSANNRSSTSTSSKDSDVASSESDYPKNSKTSLKRDWSASKISGGKNMDEFLDEALCYDENSPPKRSSLSCNERAEQSIHLLERSPRRRERQSSSQLPLHSISFYRKQQNMAVNPVSPVRRIVIDPRDTEEILDLGHDQRDKEKVRQKIQRLQQEMTKQEQYVSQASQALDLCYSTFEFSGSTELLEAEKLLLLACERRQAVMQEMRRLQEEGRMYPGEPSLAERGTINISHVTLPLKMDVVHHAAKDDECYYLLCVVRNNEEVQCSEIMSARRSLHSGNRITFPDKFIVRDLNDDFRITIELYTMKARHKELIPHDIKYHINTNKKEVSKLRLTPRKAKTDPRLVAPSPSTGSRSPAFALAGHLILSLRDMHRTQFNLIKSKHIYNNVLEGSLKLQLESEMRVDVEHRGFLTMFEDVSGLGAWHRRWCLVRGDKLSYWRYPDDEKKKIPLDTIELSHCVDREVEVVRRDVCARPNTLQLFTVRPARHTDTESLVVTRRGDRTCVRHWLSADTREERDQWCHHLNKALTLMRAWGTSTAL